MILQVGVKAVLQNGEGKILVMARSKRYGIVEGSWDIPGGRIDPGTTLLVNLEREVKEETGLVMTSAPVLIAAQDLLPREDIERHIVRLTYVATTSGEPVLDGEEHTEYRWVTFSELETLSGLDAYLKELITDGVLAHDSLALHRALLSG